MVSVSACFNNTVKLNPRSKSHKEANKRSILNDCNDLDTFDITHIVSMQVKNEVFAILLMNFNMSPADALPAIEEWFEQHPKANWEILKNLLKYKQLTLSQNQLQTVCKRQYQIFCIDDSPTVLRTIRSFLEGYNFSAIVLDDPLNALRELTRTQPDLILLDVNMPKIDGYKLCRLLRNHALLKNTPVIMVTGNKGIVDRAKAKLAGATDYLTKPFPKTEFLDVIFKYLDANHLTLDLPQQSALVTKP